MRHKTCYLAGVEQDVLQDWRGLDSLECETAPEQKTLAVSDWAKEDFSLVWGY